MVFLVVALFVLILDQLTKYYVVSNFYLGESVPVIENIFHWTYILNPGAAFGMLEGSRWLFVIIAGGWKLQYGAALFGGGAIGNLLDRMRTGLVVDFFDFRIWPIFNVADIAICVGVGLILWKILEMEFLENK